MIKDTAKGPASKPKPNRKTALAGRSKSVRSNRASHESMLAKTGESKPPQSWFEQDNVKLKPRRASEDLDAEVLEFCATQGLSSHLPAMLENIQNQFKSVGPARLSLINDPETDELYVRVGVTVRGSVSDVANAYDRYISKWSKAVPSHVANAIRLSLTVA